MTTRILMVCLGNICRSPTAEAAMREAAQAAGIDVVVDSAGTADYHVGSGPDPRTRDAAGRAGLHLTSVGRQVSRQDFEDFDLLVAMDRANQLDLLHLAPDDAARGKVRLLLDYTDHRGAEVPDPYHGGPDGFTDVVRVVRAGTTGLAAAIAAGRP
ncbi:MAG TPA: low molecular weight protein-tyrosine-phosphatase [Euzebya sp.]|nr:low molecular weight protein-tyrosine-phosphatase [Euzebya sp.]